MLTTRMRLIPATAESVRAEIDDPSLLARELEAEIPPDWPPETLVDALPWFLEQLRAFPERVGWYGWYGLTHDRPTLVGSAGFLGAPVEGTVEIGYAVLPGFRGRGYASEMVSALVRWAFEQPGVRTVAAEVEEGNTPSLRLLERLGFARTGDGREPGTLHFELRAR